jgi:hypothetical protein
LRAQSNFAPISLALSLSSKGTFRYVQADPGGDDDGGDERPPEEVVCGDGCTALAGGLAGCGNADA